ncbi:MAG: hypothetical protein A3H32_04750 [Betaproteobacteria bacterium RIFCSPLOWO2_02_FULL_63_19]|nr:MAG: hypothetical protein A3H32_04750 [Betaproteobacteria bacterium RIFCSPLOWO2_02_FULL_63_19]
MLVDSLIENGRRRRDTAAGGRMVVMRTLTYRNAPEQANSMIRIFVGPSRRDGRRRSRTAVDQRQRDRLQAAERRLSGPLTTQVVLSRPLAMIPA